MCSRIELFVSLQNIPPTAAECIWSWVQQCPLLPAVSYKGPTQCPGAPFEPENRDASYAHMQKNSFLAYGALGLCVYLSFALECGLQSISTGQCFHFLLLLGDAVGKSGEGLHDQSFILRLHGLVLFQLRYQQLKTHTGLNPQLLKDSVL